MTTTSLKSAENEVSILARVLGNGTAPLSEEIAHYILTLSFNDEDKARMHDLVVRNQRDALSAEEKEELLSFGKAGDILAILKSKARKTLGIKPSKRPVS